MITENEKIRPVYIGTTLVLTKACSVTAGNRWICFTYSHRSMVSFQTRKITPTPVHEILNYSVRSNLGFKWTWVTRTLKEIWNKWEKKILLHLCYHHTSITSTNPSILHTHSEVISDHDTFFSESISSWLEKKVKDALSSVPGTQTLRAGTFPQLCLPGNS